MKKKIIAILMSVCIVFSICAAPLGAVFAEETIASSETEELNTLGNAGDTAEFISLIVNFASNGNPKAVHGGKLITTAFSLLIGKGEEDVSSKEILKSVKELSNKMDVNHREVMNALTEMSLDSSIKTFHDRLGDLNSSHSTMNKAINSREEKKLIEAGDTDELKRYYQTIIKRAGEVTLLDKYNKTLQALTKPMDPSKHAFVVMFEKYKLKTTDAAVVGQNYKKYLDNTIAQIGLSYLYLTAYLKAEEANDKLNNASNPTDTLGQLQDAHERLQAAVKDYKKAQKNLETLNKASVQIDNGKTNNYYSASIAWINAKKAVNEGKKVTFTLYQDWVADQKKGFVDANLIDSEKKGYFTKNGEIILSGTGALTINLNGYQISGGNWDHNIFELQGQFNLTINGLAKDKLKSGQIQGINNAKTGIHTAFNSGETRIITLNNVDMSNFKEHAIYVCGYEKSDYTAQTKLYVNGGKFENAQNTCLRYRGSVTYELNQSEFINNKTKGSGGAIGADDSESAAKNAKVTNCSFTNNSAVYSGGAIGGKNFVGSDIFVSGCTFTKNSARCRGGAVIGCKEVKNCKFIENSAQNGGALFQDNTMSDIAGCTFEGNKSTENGGAINIVDELDTKVRNCTFKNNKANHSGGGVFTNYRAMIETYDSTFTGNSAGREGGAMYLARLLSYDHKLSNVTVTNNTANNAGGGLYCYKKGVSCADVTISNKVVITDNTVKGKQNNVFLVQAGGVKKSVLKEQGLSVSESKIGISSDSRDRIEVVFYASASTPYFGDNGRNTILIDNCFKLRALPGGCDK